MNILLANFQMKTWTGSELFVRDLALALHARGHSITVFAPVCGPLAQDMSMRCIACVSDLAMVAQAPDIIIGNSRDETVLCLAQFPQVPAISVCHDRTAFQGMPPRFTRIRQYVAVDENCAERLSLQHGIPREHIEIIFNGVDLQRFTTRPPLPPKPLRALYFSNYPRDTDPGVRTIAAVCQEMGIAFELAGLTAQKAELCAERRLPQYDLVFAKARCAMEAMAVGCAVIVINETEGINAMAGMVTSANIELWRRWNFGRRLMQTPTTREALRQAIATYDADDAQRCRDWVRQHVTLDATVSAFEQLAKKVVHEHQAHPPTDHAMEWREFTSHFSEHFSPQETALLAARLHEALSGQHELRDAIEQQERRHAISHEESAARERQTTEELSALRLSNDNMQRQLAALQTEAAHAVQTQAAMQSSLSWRFTRPLRWLGHVFGKPWSGT